MSISDVDDSQRASSLGWVKEEVDRSLDEARAALESYVDEGASADSKGKLSKCLTMIEQVRGTLQMVQMQGATVLTQEMENLTAALINKSEQIDDLDSAYEALMRAILQLPDYLEGVQSGKSDIAIILLPLINDLRAAHGQNAVAARALFAPHFHGILPADHAGQKKTKDVAELIRTSRHQIHLSMLGLFRGKEVEASLNRLITIYNHYRLQARTEPVVQLYWIVTALAEAIRDNGLEIDMPVNPLLGQVDRQSKLIIDQGEESVALDPPMELIRLLLFYVASSSSQGKVVSEIRQAFRLEKFLPSEEELGRLRSELTGPGSEAMEKVVQGIRQELDRARDMLDIYTRTGEQDKEKLGLMIQALRNVAGTIAMVGDQELQGDINRYCLKLDTLLHEDAEAAQINLHEVADFILKADGRMQDLQSPRGNEPTETQLGSSGFWDVMSAVVRESSINMSSAKDAISEFAAAPDEKRGQLSVATGLLQQVAGSLKIASLERASDVIYALRSYIDDELVAKEITLSGPEMESLAEAVSSADYYLEAVVGDLPNRDSALELAEAALELLGYSPDISSRFAPLEDMPEIAAEEADAAAIELQQEQAGLDELTDGLTEELEEDEAVDPEAFELQPASVEEEESAGVDFNSLSTDVEEQEADIEEIEVAAPVETEEEIAQRLAEPDSERTAVDLPSIEAVEEEISPEIEEVTVDAPVETEEEMALRLAEPDSERTAVDLPSIEAVEEEISPEIEEVTVAAPVETEEEMAQRLAEPDSERTAVDMPSIEAVEEEIAPEVEEVVAPPPAESVLEELSLGTEIDAGEVSEDMSALVMPVEDVSIASSMVEEEDLSKNESAIVNLVQDRSSLMDLSPLGEDFDEEIVDIFLEEAEEVIAALRQEFPEWSKNTDDQDALAVIRRSFHTLKGSGRMVGANLIGEFSWEIENLLNHVIDKTRKADKHVICIISEAIEVLPKLVAQLQGGSASEVDVIDIADRAHNVVSGEFQPIEEDSDAVDISAASALYVETEENSRAAQLDGAAVVPQDAGDGTPSTPLQSAELCKIYTDETRTHVAAMRSFLEQCRARSGSCLLQEEQLRVLHTLHGGAATVGADDIKALLVIAEPLAVLNAEHKSAVDDVLLDLYAGILDHIEAFLEQINGVDNNFKLDTQLLEALQQRLQDDTARVSGKVEQENDIADAVVADMSLREIETSLENLHEIMSTDGNLDDSQSVEEEGEELTSSSPAIEDPTEEPIAEEDEDEIDFEMLDIFLEETGELLTNIESNLHEWQTAPDDQEKLINIQRDTHTLKGGARMLGQTVFGDISHAMETLFMAITDSHLAVSATMFTVLHTARDYLQDIYEGIRQDSQYQAQPNDELVQQLEAFLSSDERAALEDDDDELFDGDAEPSGMALALDSVDMEEPDYADELLEIFIDEARDLMTSLDQTLHEWHSAPEDEDLIVSIQRDVHTLKGGARMVQQVAMGDLGHAMESLLVSVADGETAVSEALFKGLYVAKDQLQDIFEGLQDGEMQQAGQPELIQLLEDLRTGAALDQELSEAPIKVEIEVEDIEVVASPPDKEQTPSSALPAYAAEETPSAALSTLSAEETPSVALSALDNEETTPSGALSAYTSEETPSQAMPAVENNTTAEPKADERRQRSRVEKGTIRVKSDLIDSLVNLAGETNIFRSRLEQQGNTFRFSLGELDQTVFRLRDQLKKLELETETQILFRHENEQSKPDDENFDPLEMDRYSQLQQLSRGLVESVGDLDSLQDMLGNLTRDSELLLVQQGRVNTELQDRLMQARVVPFAASLASRLRRIIRQTCQQLDKKAELRLIGANEEMDRHVLDRMVAPLEHMLRNSIAHGIEAPEVRKARGKPETGTVTISVGREGGEITIQVADDGGGLDVEAIRKQAERKNMIVANADLNDDDIMQLVLQPGFSTAESVSQISGRGVGMDVVHNEIKQLGGTLQIESVAERGAAITIRLPFTLAISQALLVSVADDLYAIPLSSIEGVSRISQKEIDGLIAAKDEGRFTYGNDEYQVSRLGNVLGRQQAAVEDDSKPAVIMVRAGGHRVAFYVDALMGHHEIVVKSLGAQVSSVSGLAGGTILGDGRVALILDIPALVRMVAAEHGLTEVEQVRVVETAEKVAVTVMVVDDSITVRRVTTRLLERHDMEVLTAKDGVEAVAMLEEHVPDVMLLDVEMPRMDGYEVASHMRNDERYKNVPILMITSRTGAKHRERAEAIGVDRYLGKPYQESELLTNISEVLESRRR